MFGLVPWEAQTPRCCDGQLLTKLMDFFLIKKSLLKTSMAYQRKDNFFFIFFLRKDNFHSQKFVINFLVEVRINACFRKSFFKGDKLYIGSF